MQGSCSTVWMCDEHPTSIEAEVDFDCDWESACFGNVSLQVFPRVLAHTLKL